MGIKSNLDIFCGVWSLSDWNVTKPDGKSTKPYGGNVEGFLLYHPEGWVSATLLEKDRPKLSDDRLQIAELRKKLKDKVNFSMDKIQMNHLESYFLAFTGYISYSGTFEADESSVHHHLKASHLPQWINTTLSREYKFTENNNLLTLTANQNGFIDKLVWKKI